MDAGLFVFLPVAFPWRKWGDGQQPLHEQPCALLTLRLSFARLSLNISFTTSIANGCAVRRRFIISYGRATWPAVFQRRQIRLASRLRYLSAGWQMLFLF